MILSPASTSALTLKAYDSDVAEDVAWFPSVSVLADNAVNSSVDCMILVAETSLQYNDPKLTATVLFTMFAL